MHSTPGPRATRRGPRLTDPSDPQQDGRIPAFRSTGTRHE